MIDCSMARFIQILFGIFIFIFPFSIRFLAYDQNAYRFGNFSPWVSEFIYAPEILLIITFVLWLFIRIKHYGLRIKPSFFSCLLAAFVINVFVISFWRGDWILGLFFVLRMAEAGMLYILFTQNILPIRKIVQILLFGVLFQLFLGLLQIKLNHSIGLSWLGEPAVGPEIQNVAKIDLPDAVKQIRPYGTLLHPNILAGYFLVILFGVLDFLRNSSKFFWLALIGAGIWLTGSDAAIGVGLVMLGIWIIFSIFSQPDFRRAISVVMVILFAFTNTWFFLKSSDIQTQEPSYQERLEQNVVSRQMIKAHPLGVGVRNFTIEMENYEKEVLKPREFQPVHNSYFLALNETGIQGFFILLTLIFGLLYVWQAGKGVVFLAFLFLASFDHFLWDSFAGLMLIALAAGFFNLQNKIADS